MLPAIPKKILATVVMSFFSPKSQQTQLDLLKGFMTILEGIPRQRWAWLAAVGRAIFGRRDILAKLPQIACPTAVAVGEDDAYRPVRESEAMAAAIPGATLTKIPDAGHVSNVEQPEIANRLLDEFLGEHWAV
jgi:pimeloyl-ACP methyl ester carboxylesterase